MRNRQTRKTFTGMLLMRTMHYRNCSNFYVHRFDLRNFTQPTIVTSRQVPSNYPLTANKMYVFEKTLKIDNNGNSKNLEFTLRILVSRLFSVCKHLSCFR